MGIFATIQCDVCTAQMSYDHIGKTLLINLARKLGWTVGNTIKCDRCRKPSKSGFHTDDIYETPTPDSFGGSDY